jgi:hypothetical protein
MGTGTMPPVSNVDPNGLQSSSTVSTATGLALIAASGDGETVATLLRLSTHPSEIVTAGLSMVSLGRVSLFTAGLVLVALGIILNVASLVIRWQNRYAEAERCEREIDRRVQAALQDPSVQRPKGPSGYPNG